MLFQSRYLLHEFTKYQKARVAPNAATVCFNVSIVFSDTLHGDGT